mmetsp:Transcript_121274/g.387539  ORF Transcript_121274/g.387539 Transcript_121274/m.387539 type:complete len:241 (-) Transcript_121274:1456-2178(-)
MHSRTAPPERQRRQASCSESEPPSDTRLPPRDGTGSRRHDKGSGPTYPPNQGPHNFRLGKGVWEPKVSPQWPNPNPRAKVQEDPVGIATLAVILMMRPSTATPQQPRRQASLYESGPPSDKKRPPGGGAGSRRHGRGSVPKYTHTHTHTHTHSHSHTHTHPINVRSGPMFCDELPTLKVYPSTAASQRPRRQASYSESEPPSDKRRPPGGGTGSRRHGRGSAPTFPTPEQQRDSQVSQPS